MRTSKFDLTLEASEQGEKLHFTFEYSTKLFRKETLVRFISYFKKAASSVIEDPGKKIADLEIISEEEKREILFDFNDTEVEFSGDKTIHELFEQQVERTPEHIAVIPSEASTMPITYGELNKRANRLAWSLREKGVKPDTIVALMMSRSIEMMVAIFGILKAGGAYLPIDPHYPEDRIRYMLADSNARVLVSDLSKVSWETEVVTLNELSEKRTTQPTHLTLPTHLSYLIYTSGSTGRPKGAAIRHFSLVNRLNWMQKQYPIGSRDTLIQKTTITFDVSVWELFWWSMTGARLCVPHPDAHKDLEMLISAIEAHNVTVIHFVPSMLGHFLEHIAMRGENDRVKSLRYVIASGEELKKSHWQSFHRLLCRQNGTGLANLYGPTEAAIDVSYFDCTEEGTPDRIPIGKPLDNIKLYILDAHRHIVPVGVSGELYIAGVGLARGYINRPELTAEKFNKSCGTSISYKSGDLARWLPDGNIEFLGRTDFQVKIRGFRIELEEIESRLLKHEEIKEAVVLLKEGTEGKTHLSAYIVSNREFNASQLREYMAGEVPDYMIPSYFVKVEQIPLTPSGKVDRKALQFHGIKLGSEVEYEAPRNRIEEKIARIWMEVLKLDRVGIHENFFDLGGTSLDMIKINTKFKDLFNEDEAVVQMFRYTTISSFARYLSQKRGGEAFIDQVIDRPVQIDKIKKSRVNQKSKRRGNIDVSIRRA